MLKEEYKRFVVKKENNVDTRRSQMKIKLKDNIPCQTLYIFIPCPLYNESKHNINICLITNG